ncbi:hypothetical protein [Engelhardtia mirabilis]|uniref:Uncharacterized protein n=1 Tax=Engelhardtia mirabilis TaxID=2528011 RepID=A0A518BJ87_9BACT|nr:hypothetical protein Pla133_21180 [Planctomycetes bacterium Pla133]QDV01367.1 hypothetical protein Pla86_21180 [Planctomycetes bacterium Pla86]
MVDLASLPAFASPPVVEGGWSEVDWTALGLTLSIAGSFLLANAILLRHPRDLVAEHFGQTRQRLGSIRGYVFHRVQVALGFGLLLAGFGLQLVGRYTPGSEGAVGAAVVGDGSGEFPIGWVGLLVVGVGLLQLGGWWVSQRLFRRYVRDYLVERESDIETDSKLAREVGELFGLEMLPEDTVQSYVARLRQRLNLPRREAHSAGGRRAATARTVAAADDFS